MGERVGVLRRLLRAAGILLAGLVLLEAGLRLQRPSSPALPLDPENALRFPPGVEAAIAGPEFTFTIQANSFGRRDREWPAGVLDDSASIVFIGDGMVLGYGLSEEDCIPTRLEHQFLQAGYDVECLNYGTGSSTALPEYLQLLRQALADGTRADTILVGIFIGNDFDQEALPAGNEALARPEGQPSAGPGSRLDRLKAWDFLKTQYRRVPLLVDLAFEASNLLQVNLYPSATSSILLRDYTRIQRDRLDRHLALLSDMQVLAHAHGREVTAVLFPNRVQVENYESISGRLFSARKPNHYISTYCRRQGMRCIDLLPPFREAFKANREHLHFPVSRHLNEKGAELAAHTIFTELRDSR